MLQHRARGTQGDRSCLKKKKPLKVTGLENNGHRLLYRPIEQSPLYQQLRQYRYPFPRARLLAEVQLPVEAQFMVSVVMVVFSQAHFKILLSSIFTFFFIRIP